MKEVEILKHMWNGKLIWSLLLLLISISWGCGEFGQNEVDATTTPASDVSAYCETCGQWMCLCELASSRVTDAGATAEGYWTDGAALVPRSTEPSVPSFTAPHLLINTPNKYVIRIDTDDFFVGVKYDGTLDYDDGYVPDEAAKVFWESIASWVSEERQVRALGDSGVICAVYGHNWKDVAWWGSSLSDRVCVICDQKQEKTTTWKDAE